MFVYVFVCVWFLGCVCFVIFLLLFVHVVDCAFVVLRVCGCGSLCGLIVVCLCIVHMAACLCCWLFVLM